MTTSSDGKVCLWRNSKRWRPQVSTLLERTFGCNEAETDIDDLAEYVREKYGDDPEVQEWLQQSA